MIPHEALEKLVRSSINLIMERKIDVYSYAIYFDHESKRRISICIDTKDNSRAVVAKSNEWTEGYFREFLEGGNVDAIVNFSVNSGRNYSLGDFKHRNLVSSETETNIDFGALYMLPAIKTVISHQEEIIRFSLNPQEVLFSCSTNNDEFGISWFAMKSGSL